MNLLLDENNTTIKTTKYFLEHNSMQMCKMKICFIVDLPDMVVHSALEMGTVQPHEKLTLVMYAKVLQLAIG